MLILYNCHLPVESFDIVGLKGLKTICGDISGGVVALEAVGFECCISVAWLCSSVSVLCG